MQAQVAGRKRRDRGIEPYCEAVGHWKRLSGDPTLGETSREDCERFERRLFRLPGRRGPKLLFRRSAKCRAWLRVSGQPEAAQIDRLLAREEHDYRLLPAISQNTVHKICCQMESLFRWAGPTSKRCRQALDLFSGIDREGRPRRLPWLDSPAKTEGAERVFTREEIVRWLAVCRYAREPRIEGLTPEAWWRALLVTLYYTALRIGTALAARYSWIERDGLDSWLNVPGEAMKAQRPEPICLKPPVMAALESIRRPGCDVAFRWPWPPSGSRQALYREKNRLLDLAGIAAERHFGFHAIRACAGDALYDLDPEMAREALCHRDLRTTEQSYVRKATRRKRRAAAAAMPALGERTLFEK
jgi:integrase